MSPETNTMRDESDTIVAARISHRASVTTALIAAVAVIVAAFIGWWPTESITPYPDSKTSFNPTPLMTQQEDRLTVPLSSINLDIAHPVEFVTFNSYTNNKVMGDEHNFVRAMPIASPGVEYLSNSISVNEGDELYVYLYVHNNASASSALIATDIRGQFDILDETKPDLTKTIRGFLESSNCGLDSRGSQGDACVFWNDVNVTSKNGKPFTLEYVPSSAKYINNSGYFKISDSALYDLDSENAPLLGDTTMNGQIPACADHAGFLVITVKTVFTIE